MAELQRPHFAIPDDLDPKELPRLLRLMIDFTAQQNKLVREQVEREFRRKSDRIVADAVRVMEGEISFDKAARGNVGDVLYLIGTAGEKGYFAAWGDGTTPAPTDPGTGPDVGAPHALLSATHTDTLASAVSRGSLIYGNSTPAYAELAVPGSPSILHSDATDVAWLTKVTTRVDWFECGVLEEITGVGAVRVVRGTSPDAYVAWPLDAANDLAFQVNWSVPADWLSGNVSLLLDWTTDGAAANNWKPVAEYLAVGSGSSFAGAGNDLAPAATSANVAADLRTRTTLGSFSVSAVGNVVRLVVGRAPFDAGDTFAGTIHLVRIGMQYTSIY